VIAGIVITAGIGVILGPVVNAAIDFFPPVEEDEPTNRGRERTASASRQGGSRVLRHLPLVGVFARKGDGPARTGYSIRRPIVDLAVAALFALSYFQFEGDWFRIIAVDASAIVFLALAVMDLETHYLPDKITIPGLVIAFAVSPFWPHLEAWSGAIGAVVGLAIFAPFAGTEIG
jgi:prepilin signal peptidase PulO-like enzyme (type II secretory pathway)